MTTRFTLARALLATAAILCTFLFGYLLVSHQDNPLRDKLVGTWVSPSGSSVTINADGTALDQLADGSRARQYRWSIDGDVLTFERDRNRQSFAKFLDDSIERLLGDSRLESYKIIELSGDSLTIEDGEKNAVRLWNRKK